MANANDDRVFPLFGAPLSNANEQMWSFLTWKTRWKLVHAFINLYTFPNFQRADFRNLREACQSHTQIPQPTLSPHPAL